jgi:hypothetical protein
MEYRIFYTGGDTVVRVFQGANVESYQFQLSHQITGVEVDPHNQVLDGMPEGKKSIPEDVPIFSLSPNPNHGSFFFRLQDAAGEENAENVAVEIFNVAGQKVYYGMYEGCVPYMEYPLQMEHVAEGLYYVRFRFGNRTEMQKILVE